MDKDQQGLGDSTAPMSMVGSGSPGTPLPTVVGPPQRPGTLGTVEHYDLLSLLGEGGMGMVFLARDTRTGAKVALKLLRPSVAGSARAAAFFRKEVNHLARLAHPHIIRVLDSAQDERSGWFAMPYLERGSLDRLLREKGPLRGDQAVQLALQIAEALACAHSKGIIHRDLKPRNVLLTDDGQALLTDFGLARSLVNDEMLDVQNPRVEGTAHYLSPQAAAGEQEDTRGDIYAFGAMLYEMLTGKAPYADVSPGDIAQAIAAGPPASIPQLNPKVPDDLARIAEWAMARELKERYAGMGDLVTDLERVRTSQEPHGPHTRIQPEGLPRPAYPVSALTLGLLGVLMLEILWVAWLKPVPSRQVAPQGPPLIVTTNFSAPQINSWVQVSSVRWEVKPVPTFLVPQDDEVFAVSAQGRLLSKLPRPGGPGARSHLPILGADVDGDRIDEVFLSWTKGREVSISSLRKETWAEATFSTEGADSHPRDRRDEPGSALIAKRYLPATIDNAGRTNRTAKLLAFLHTNRSKRPRALCCFDYATRKLEWQTPVGPPLLNMEIMDLNGDGEQEILCGSASPCNGNAEGEAGDDHHAYVFAFSSAGKILWKRELRGELGEVEVKVVDLDGNGRPEILALVRSSEANHATNAPSLGQVVQLNPLTGDILTAYKPPVCLLSWLTLDLQQDGKVEILCSDCEGVLHVVNSDLRPRGRIQVTPVMKKEQGSFDQIHFELRGTARLRRGQAPFVVATSWEVHDKEFRWGHSDGPIDRSERKQEWLYVLDMQLRTVARYQIAEQSPATFSRSVMITDLEADGEDEILLLSDRVEVVKLVR